MSSYRLTPSASGDASPDGLAHLKLVYVEGDEQLARLTSKYLTVHGVEVSMVARGASALPEVLRVRPDVVLLDLVLPGMDALEVCRQIRQRVDVPIIMLSARSEEADRVMGLEMGADDYVSKPFSSRELLARVRAKARRGRGKVGLPASRLQVGSLSIDPTTMVVTLRDERIVLTTMEFFLLRALAERPGRVLGRDLLLLLAHGSAHDAFDRSIDVHVSRLRSKLENDPRKPRMLKTIRGVGYMLTSGE
jgi:DNA-binding response OmpR family regulator